MRSPIWSDDVTHIYRNLQNRQLGPVSVKEPAFGGLQLTIKAPQAPRISAHQSHILGLTPASPQVSQVKLSPHKHFTFILPTNRSYGEVYINTAEQKRSSVLKRETENPVCSTLLLMYSIHGATIGIADLHYPSPPGRMRGKSDFNTFKTIAPSNVADLLPRQLVGFLSQGGTLF